MRLIYRKNSGIVMLLVFLRVEVGVMGADACMVGDAVAVLGRCSVLDEQ